VDTRNVVADLAAPGAVDRLLGNLEDHADEIEILVNNAGYGNYGEFSASDLETEIGMIRLHVLALTGITKHLLRGMLARGSGRILNVASTAAFRPGPLYAVYAASKAYVLSFSEALSAELEGTGVAVTALCPGPTRTEFQDVASIPAGDGKGSGMAAAADVAAFACDALFSGKVVAVPGLANRVRTNLLRVLPRSFVRRLVLKARHGKEDRP
jgi:hypothetical protein